MRHGDYTASLAFDEDASLFRGTVQGLPAGDAVHFEGSSVAELREDFDGAVRLYEYTLTAQGRATG